MKPMSATTSLNRVVIGGGSGFVGSALVNLLRKKGYQPQVISRKPTGGQLSWDALAKSGFPKDTFAVVNLAGRNIGEIRKWDAKYKREVRESRIQTTSLIRDLMATSEFKPKVFVSSSAVGIYPTNTDEKYTEEGCAKGDDYFAQLCSDWEAAAELPPDIDVRHVTIRIGVVLGRAGGMVERLFWPFYMGAGGHVGSGRQPLPWIHVDDLCGLVHHLLVTDEARGVFNGVAPQLITNAQFTAAFARALRRPAVLPTPAVVLKTLMGAERAEMMLTGAKVWPKRTLDSGYAFKYADIDTACREFARVS